MGEVRVPMKRSCRRRRVLVDREQNNCSCLQIFAEPSRRSIGDRVLQADQRHGSLGFGKGNFEALLEAIEREQDLRGNL